MIIDSHQHFWDISRSDYGWLQANHPHLYRNYLPSDFTALLTQNNVDATVLIQAAPSEAETRYLFRLAHSNSFVAGVVGWVDFESPDVDRCVETLVTDGEGKLKGLRPMIQDIDDTGWILRTDLDAAFRSMTRHHLVFDALVKPAHLLGLRKRLYQHPDLRAVLNHAGKPDFDRGQFDGWAHDVERLARDTDISVKLSGILTEVKARTPLATLRPYLDHLFGCFGVDRILWGSDWPVLNMSSNYAEWLQTAREWVHLFAPHGEADIFARTATRIYRLDPRATWAAANSQTVGPAHE